MEYVAVANRPNWTVEVSPEFVAASAREQIQGKQQEHDEAIGEMSKAVAERNASWMGKLAAVVPSWGRCKRNRKLKRCKAEIEALTKWYRFLQAVSSYEKLNLNANDFEYFFPGDSFQAMNMDSN